MLHGPSRKEEGTRTGVDAEGVMQSPASAETSLEPCSKYYITWTHKKNKHRLSQLRWARESDRSCRKTGEFKVSNVNFAVPGRHFHLLPQELKKRTIFVHILTLPKTSIHKSYSKVLIKNTCIGMLTAMHRAFSGSSLWCVVFELPSCPLKKLLFYFLISLQSSLWNENKNRNDTPL